MPKRPTPSNWVDRDEPLEEKVIRVLAYAYGRDPLDPCLREWASVVRGMVEADASEVQVAAYLNTLSPLEGSAPRTRLLAVTLWHIAKCGLVRDAAQRRIAELAVRLPPGESMGEFLARAVANAPNREQYRPPPGTPKANRRT